jgi:hypothetical protein
MSSIIASAEDTTNFNPGVGEINNSEAAHRFY